MAEKPEIDPFLANIDAKIAALQQLRESYVAAAALGIGITGNVDATFGLPFMGSGAAAPSHRDDSSVELPTGIFRDKGVAEAVRLYLGFAKRKQTHKEIIAALREGGLESTAANFEKMLVTTLHRMKASGELLQFKDGWDLAESYPENLRQRLRKAE